MHAVVLFRVEENITVEKPTEKESEDKAAREYAVCETTGSAALHNDVHKQFLQVGDAYD